MASSLALSFVRLFEASARNRASISFKPSDNVSIAIKMRIPMIAPTYSTFISPTIPGLFRPGDARLSAA